jgi:hypothetical protein
MECPTIKASFERPICCYFVYPYHSWSSRDCSLNTPQPSQPSFSWSLVETIPHWMVPLWNVFISSLLPLLGRMHNYCLLLLIWFPFMVPDPSSCDLCMHTTWTGSVVTRTLLFHIYYSCAGTVIRSCTHNHTIYSVYSHGNQHVCFNHNYSPWEQWVEVQRLEVRRSGAIGGNYH